MTTFSLRVTKLARLGRPENVRILKAMVMVSGFLALTRGVGAAKEVALAARFGAGPTIDAYAFTFALTIWPVATWTSSTSSVLIPTFVGLASRSQEELVRFREELLGFTLVLGLLAGSVIAGVLAIGSGDHAFGLVAAVADKVRLMALPIASVAPLGMMAGLFSAQLMASHRHSNSLIDGVPSTVLLGALLLLPASPSGLAIATACGYGAQVLALTLAQPAGVRRVRPRFSFRSVAWADFWRHFGLMLLGQSVLTAGGVVDQFSAAQLGASANATIGYANRLLLLLSSLIATSIGRALLPVLSEMRDAGVDVAWRVTKRWALLLLAVGALGAALAWPLAPLGVKLLFERGAFKHDETLKVASAVRFGLLQLPFYCAGMVLVQRIASTGRYVVFFWGNCLNLLLKLAGNVVLSRFFGVPGLLLATALMYLFSSTFLFFAGRPRPSAGRSRATRSA